MKAIIWDFDGTLYDTYPRILDSFNKVLNSKYHLEIATEEIVKLVSIDTKHCVREISKRFNMNYDTLLKEIRKYYDHNSEVFEEIFPEAKELVSNTQNQIIHTLVTHRDKYSTEKRLMAAGILELFKYIITGDDHFPAKPNPESFEYMIKMMKIPKSEIFGIGDRDIDIQAGKNSGIKTIYFNQKSKFLEGADYNINSHFEIKKIMEVQFT